MSELNDISESIEMIKQGVKFPSKYNYSLKKWHHVLFCVCRFAFYGGIIYLITRMINGE